MNSEFAPNQRLYSMLPFTGPLPVRALPGVGSKLSRQLSDASFSTVQELRPLTKAALISRFGDKPGEQEHIFGSRWDPCLVLLGQGMGTLFCVACCLWPLLFKYVTTAGHRSGRTL